MSASNSARAATANKVQATAVISATVKIVLNTLWSARVKILTDLGIKWESANIYEGPYPSAYQYCGKLAEERLKIA